MDSVLYEINMVGRQSKSQKKLNKTLYVRFTKNQKDYLRRIYKVLQSPKNHYEFIMESLLRMSFPGQVITNQKIYAWFKNQRFRTNKKL
jgi:hypothetical protein